MRELIDRKSLIEALRKDIQEYKDTDGQSIPFKTGMIYRQIEAIKIIEEQPTVELPIKNIVKRLEETKTKSYVTGITSNPYEFGACYAMNDAIKIVKEEGEINDNT